MVTRIKLTGIVLHVVELGVDPGISLAVWASGWCAILFSFYVRSHCIHSTVTHLRSCDLPELQECG